VRDGVAGANTCETVHAMNVQATVHGVFVGNVQATVHGVFIVCSRDNDNDYLLILAIIIAIIKIISSHKNELASWLTWSKG
jgi:hypothetical protein